MVDVSDSRDRRKSRAFSEIYRTDRGVFPEKSKLAYVFVGKGEMGLR